MKPHAGIRNTLKWGGAVLSMLLLVVWVVSECRGIARTCEDGSVVGICRGMFFVADRPVFPVTITPPMYQQRPTRGLFTWNDRPLAAILDPQSRLPIGVPFLASFLLTASAWRFDALARRRALAGFCLICDYDRAGLAADTACPECGKVSVQK